MAKDKEEKRKEGLEKLDLSIYPKDEKGNAILPADVFDKFGKLLPDGTKSDDGRVAFNGGVLRTLGNNPERDKEIQRKGADALHAMQKQRRTIAETIDIFLRKNADKETVERLGLADGATMQDAMIASMMKAATNEDTKAANFLRDTVGEKPVDRSEISAEVMTDADKRLLEKVSKRLEQEEE